ncbi:MAG TPA: VWA-like domain-containing protein [Saprospiraceae bacterium]|nr:VWA-like domain-containing protein [Saprospiraceae bacterium]HMQ82194.1 VWA-like domain-containing protein [Saprospiraceae bacterium]
MNAKLEKSLQTTAVQLILKEPFFGHLFSMLSKRETESIATLAVCSVSDQFFQLLLNSDYWFRLENDAHRYGVLKHELLHLALRHLSLARFYHHKLLFNIAADLVVNQYIAPTQLPSDVIRLESFPFQQLLPFQSLDYYYKKLLDHATNDALQNQLSDFSDWLDRHQFWHSEQSQTAQQHLERHLGHTLLTIARRLNQQQIGQLPSELLEQLQWQLAPEQPSINWQRALRLFVAAGGRTAIKNTVRRPSKRYGTTPGIKIERQLSILVAIDTSGSISEDDLVLFFREIHQIWRQGARIWLVECDYKIQHQYAYSGKTPKFVQGRGGTNFSEPISLVNERLPDVAIYFTDGLGPVPEVASRRPLLWVISPKGWRHGDRMWQQLPGKKLKMPAVH